MTLFANVNVTSSNGGPGYMFNLKQTLVSASWVVTSSSDGTTYDANTDLITHSGSGAGGMANHRAWFRIKDPGGRREFVLQTSGTTGEWWRIQLCESGSFGTGSILICPSSTLNDVSVVHADLPFAGNAVNPKFSKLFGGNLSGTYLVHAIAFNTPDPGTDVYPFFAFTSLNGTGIPNSVFFCDSMLSGTFHPSDPSPMYVLCASSSATAGGINAAQFAAAGESSLSGSTYYKYGTVNERYTKVTISDATSTQVGNTPTAYTSFPALDPWDGKHYSLPALVHRPVGTTPGIFWKGMLRNIKMKTSTARQYPDTLDLNGSAQVFVGSMLIPWPSGTAAIT